MKFEIGEKIVTDNGTGIVLASSIQGSSDACVNLYLVDFGGHMDVVAQDNATNWVVGDESDMGRNYDMIDTIGAGRLSDFAETVVRNHDGNLRDWIVDRIADAKAYKNMSVWFTCDDLGHVGAHGVTYATAYDDCEGYREMEPENGWKVFHE